MKTISKYCLISTFLCICLITSASAKSITYQIEEGIKVHVSNGQLSAWTDIGGGQRYLPQSQVMVGMGDWGRPNAFLSLKNDGNKETLNIYMDKIVKNHMQDETVILGRKVALYEDNSENKNEFQFKIIPTAMFWINWNREAELSFHLSSRYKYAGKKKRRDFYYGMNNRAFAITREGESWFSLGEDKPISHATKGFELLTKAFLFDAAGGISKDHIDQWEKVEVHDIWTDRTNTVYVITDFDGFALIANTNKKGTPRLNQLFVIPDPRIDKNKPRTTTRAIESLRSVYPREMNEAAIKIGKEQLFDEKIILTLIDLLEAATNTDRGILNSNLIDGLAWCAINLGKSGDKRGIPVLKKTISADLPRKIVKHAKVALKKLQE
ncbi:MAG: hypothetical protein ACRBHB_12955 [Arenicella sp.]